MMGRMVTNIGFNGDDETQFNGDDMQEIAECWLQFCIAEGIIDYIETREARDGE